MAFASSKALLIAMIFGSATLSGFASDKKTQPLWPESFFIGRRTFFDFGPPFDFYEVFSVRTSGENTSSVQRILLTPPGNRCLQPATLETANGTLKKNVRQLLGDSNPCTIPSKELNREAKRCKHCLAFSGEDVVMQVACGGDVRHIKMEILDRDMFDAHPRTPQQTSWTMRILSEMDQLPGSTVMDRPAFTADLPDSPATAESIPLIGDLQSGSLDGLFERGEYRPSELVRQSQAVPAKPGIVLAASSPFRPTVYTLPEYPPLARIAHIGGQVKFMVRVQTGGRPSVPAFSEGNPILQKVVENSVATWMFPAEAAGQDVNLAISFDLNCP